MSKYDLLWDWVHKSGTGRFSLTFAEIESMY